MARVHSFDAYSGVELAVETTWGTVQTTGFKRVHPVVDPGETSALLREQIAIAQEFASLGARTSYDYGRATVAGALSIIPAYNSEAFGILLKELHGGGTVGFTAGRSPSGVLPGGTPTGYTTHVFYPQVFTDATSGYEGGVGKGLTIRAWKSGGSDAGTIDRFVGCIVTGLTWDQRPASQPVATFTFVGKQLSPLAASGLSIAAVPSVIQMLYRDFKNRSTQPVCPGDMSVGGTAVVIDGFSASFTSGIEIPKSFITAPDDVQKPAHSGLWGVKAQFQSRLQQNYATGPHLRHLYASGGATLIARYVSNTNAYDGGSEANRMPYAFEIRVPGAVVDDSRPNLTAVGAGQHPWSVEGMRAQITAGAYADPAVTRTVPWMIQDVSSFTSF